MTASSTLPQPDFSSKPSIGRSGVLTLSGFGIKVRMQCGHLEIEDGIGPERRRFHLPRVGHGLKRLVCISEDGFTTLSALKWLADIGASFVILDRSGKVSLVTGPTASSDARLRRAQALALGNGVGLEISRALIDAKLEGQERVARERLNDLPTARAIAALRERLPESDSVGSIRSIEAHAAVSYFAAWRDIPVLWPKIDLRRVPAHWLTVGNRHSPLSGGPRLAITPVHAMLNYCFGLLQAEARLAISAIGLDAGLGMGLHTDTPNRDSLALDVLEPVRTQVENWVLGWVIREPLRRCDFVETANGNCRLMPHLCARLGETAPTWGKLVAPWAEYVSQALWSRVRRFHRLSTPLTQQHRREVQGRPSFPTIKVPAIDRLCRGCGKAIQRGSTNCNDCAMTVAIKRLTSVSKLGRIAARSPEARAKHIASHLRHTKANSAWDSSKQPAWLTDQLFSEKIQPLLAEVRPSAIAKQIGVSRWYAGRIREGYQPHPRHRRALARLVGVGPVSRSNLYFRNS